jgi:hypothetical protein
MNTEEKKNTSSTLEVESLAKRYLNSLNEREKQGYEIAKAHLGMSFSLYKSNGFLQYQKEITK